jgi:hypothetical protein
MHHGVEIKTHDGTVLRGWFYPAGTKAPVVIMSAGVSRVLICSYTENLANSNPKLVIWN